MQQPEHALQRAVAEFLDLALPASAFWTSIDAATRSAIEGQQKKARGVKPGIPDVLIVCKPITLWIELKARTGSVQETQRRVMRALIANGHQWYVARSVAEVETILIRCGIPLRARMAA